MAEGRQLNMYQMMRHRHVWGKGNADVPDGKQKVVIMAFPPKKPPHQKQQKL